METQITLTTNDAVLKSPEPDPKRTNTKPLSFTNGVLKRHNITATPPPSTPAVTYKECLKNHAAALGSHALDGCGEFMPDRSSNPNLPVTLKCAACGCHRNFHRREPEDFSTTALQLVTPPPAVDYQLNHRQHHRQAPPPVPLTSVPYSPSPPPISSSYYHSSAPRMLLALSTGLPLPENTHTQEIGVVADPVSGSGRKRFRTKFSSLQKEKMYEVAERVGWKMQKRDEELVNELCNRIGVGREVFKVWMHNNKSTFNKRSSSAEVENVTPHTVCPTSVSTNNNVFFHNGNNGEVSAMEQNGMLSHSNMLAANGVDM